MPAIVQNGDPVLRKKAKEVPIADIKSAKIKKILASMKKALVTQPDGVAIAAPQIGVSLRIFVVSGKIFEKTWQRGESMPEGQLPTTPDAVFINPVITKLSKKKRWMHEGCLSVRPLWGEVERSLNATVTAYDENGTAFTRGAGGLLAHIFQHETDHLEGVLFVDMARNVAPGHVPESAKKPARKKRTPKEI